MGIRIDQVNLNSFRKVFPLRNDVTNIVLSTIISSDSIVIDKQGEEFISISLRPATKEKIGGVIVGGNIDVNNGIISVPSASSTIPGVIKVGNNIDYSNNTISLKYGSKSDYGLLKVGDNINVNNGVISAARVANATKQDAGIVQIGNNINVDTNGIISTDVNKTYVDNAVAELKEVVDNELSEKVKELESTILKQQKEINTLKTNVTKLEELALLTSTTIQELIKRIEMLESIVSEELLELRPLLNSAFYIGSATLNGYSSRTTVKLPSYFTNTNYRVSLTPNSETNGNLGEVWLDNKTSNSFDIINTGAGTMIRVDFIIITSESDSPSYSDTFPYLKGQGTFNGTAGATVSITNINTSDYKVMILPVKSSNTNEGDLGEYWVSNKTNTSFKVFNSGKDVTSKFDYIVFKSGNPVYNETTNPIIEGSSVFAGSQSEKTISISETEFSNNKFSVIITPSANPNGDLGEIYVTKKTTNTFTVCNTGSAVTAFDYVIIG